ncbi:MAG: Uma2 family endonuclease [Planctomycetes bacterium]|nr:Uma2 family endonuclease [Planctomycetota bacterium]
MSVTTLVTADQLLQMPKDGFRYELVSGELTKTGPAGLEHGIVGGSLHGRLCYYVLENKLGVVPSSDTGFRLASDPDTVLAPDVAFISAERYRAVENKEGFFEGAPDLAVEVVSPSDTRSEVADKVSAWLDAGARMVWVVHPARRTVTVYRSAADIETLTERDELDGHDVVPGFRCRVSDLFEPTR